MASKISPHKTHRRRRPSALSRARQDSAPLYAALDLGTNNCRMLIARQTKQGFHVVDSFSRITRLGEDLASSGHLSEEAMQRTLKALQVCSKKIQNRNVRFVRSVATEACRRANNGMDFLSRVETETGLHLEAIKPEEEAKLALTGCASLLSYQKPKALVFDIGGGSTEVMWIELDRLGEPQVLDVISLPMGVVNMSEKHSNGEDIDMAAYDEIKKEVFTSLEDFDHRNQIAKDVADHKVQMLGTSGTVTTLGAVYLKLPRYLRSKVDGMSLSLEKVRDISHELTNMNCSQRAAHPCIGESRADLVLAGCSILEALCHLWPVDELTIADRGIREGILLKLMRGAQKQA